MCLIRTSTGSLYILMSCSHGSVSNLSECEKYVMYLHVNAKMQRNHSCKSKMQKTPHFGIFSNGTLLFHLCESKQGRTKGSSKTGSLVYPS